jgi:predicted nucleotide-binding protein (sugar kinase/HSP70/actin superfamily)
LLRYLHDLRAGGWTRQEIVDSYVFFTAGSCGPCRFGTYESEFRLALENAGFHGFRVLSFQQDHGIQAATGEPGLKFTVDFGMGMLNAIVLADLVSDISYRLRPYEVNAGKTDEVVRRILDQIEVYLCQGHRFELSDSVPVGTDYLASLRTSKVYRVANTMGKIYAHLRGPAYRSLLRNCGEELMAIKVDRLRVRPVVKVVGEFWAQLTEGAGNYHLFPFLEAEGAELIVDPISTWILYLLHQAKQRMRTRARLESVHDDKRLFQMRFDHVAYKKLVLYSLAETLYKAHYRTARNAMCGIGTDLPSQHHLGQLASPHYNQLARGGEGHLEVGKSLYYANRSLAHLVISVKPFGCLPSTQSDAVQWSLVNRAGGFAFLPVETSGEGEIDALSRVQLAMADARARAFEEFEECAHRTGIPLADIQGFAGEHPGLCSSLYEVPRTRGVVGLAANFVLHVAKLMRNSSDKARLYMRNRVVHQ